MIESANFFAWAILLSDCGVPNPEPSSRIVGGENTEIEQIPWQVKSIDHIRFLFFWHWFL